MAIWQFYNWGINKKAEENKKLKEDKEKQKETIENLRNINTEKGKFEAQLQECKANITKTNEYHEKKKTAG